jgi:hypothetical protein
MRPAIVLVCLLGLAGVASAQPARQLYEEGLRHYGAGEYDDAISKWEVAYQLSKAPLLLFNLGQAHRLKGDCVRARALYARYREAEPAPKNLEELVAAEALCPVEPVSETAPEPVAETPPAETPRVAVENEPPPAPRRRRSRRGQRIAGIATAGAGVVIGGAGAYFGWRAADAAATVEEREGEWTPELADLEARGARDRTIALIAGGAGAAAIVTGAVVYLLGRDDPAVEVSPTRGGAAASWRVRF